MQIFPSQLHIQIWIIHLAVPSSWPCISFSNWEIFSCSGLDESYTALEQALKDNQELQKEQADSLKWVAEWEKRNKNLEGEVNQLKKKLKYAEQLEEQNFRLTTEERSRVVEA